jgi:hypothetical protein
VCGDALRVTWADEVAGPDYASELLWTSAAFPAHPEWPLGHTVARCEHATRGAVSIELDALPPGDVALRVRVLDGFGEVASEPVEVQIPGRPLRIEITPCLLGSVVPAGAPMLIAGTAWPFRGHLIPDGAAYRWTLAGLEVARGNRAWIEAPHEVGAHVLTLTVAWAGRETAAGMPPTVTPAGSDPRWQAFADVFRERDCPR